MATKGATTSEPTAPQKKEKRGNEQIKIESNYLRGSILEGLADDSTGALDPDDTQLTKFHGIYQQDDRDLRSERRKAKLEPAYCFMARVRVPGGVCSPEQWLAMDRLSEEFGNSSLKLTTRQAFQIHGIIKKNLRETIRQINGSLMDTIAACGDVNRNVMCNPNPFQSHVHGDVLAAAQAISDHLTPKTKAYYEIWVDDGFGGDKQRVTFDPEEDVEPIYGRTYLPRKFKIVVAVPPSNDVDVYAHDLAFVAIVEDDKILGYNVLVGGGMGMSHGNEDTFPRLAEPIGFCSPDQVVAVAEKVVLVQKEFGNRQDRKNARLKYTIETHGLDWFRDSVESLLGSKLQAPRPVAFDNNGDRYGWTEGVDGRDHLTLFIQNGRVQDSPDLKMKSALREVASIHSGDFRLTANQNLIIANISKDQRPKIEAVLKNFGMDQTYDASGLRLNSMACVALPTCGLALAESERYLPDLITELEAIIEEAGLRDDAITIRMTGCPNGCARPYIGEIALVGRSPGKYNLYLGGGFAGDRLNKLFKISIKSDEIADALRPVIHDYATSRETGERFGDFVIRNGYVTETKHGRDFHKDFVA